MQGFGNAPASQPISYATNKPGRDRFPEITSALARGEGARPAGHACVGRVSWRRYTDAMRARAVFAGLLLSGAAVAVAVAQRSDAFAVSADHPAIQYTTAPVDDPVSRLNQQLEAGTAQLRFEAPTGHLRAVLDLLRVPIQSQVLVFSQTSLQASRIDSDKPRAIYFNDSVSVGWVRGSDLLELAAQDERQGTIFYTLAQSPGESPRFERRNTCLLCHVSWETRAVPGPFVLSTYPRKTDLDYADGGVVDHRVPLSRRWGGWYVTGREVPQRHMGNRGMLRADAADPAHTPPPPKYQSVEKLFDAHDYLAPYSDVVSLLVLEHQAHLTNLLTRAGWEARLARYEVGAMAPGADALAPLPRRVVEAVDELVDYMIYVDEAPLPGAVSGSSGFTELFTSVGPRDEKGRSLRDFDLHRRLMRYPLSYMIYTAAFDGLPVEVKAAVYKRLWAILSGQVRNEARYAHLTPERRQAIVEILRATKPGLPEYFQVVTH